MSAIGWYNGTIGKLTEMTVSMQDRAVYFGDGCYEACLAAGRSAFALDRHLDRFFHSLALLSIPFDMDREALKKTLRGCLAAADEARAELYWQVSRATAPRTHAFPQSAEKPNLMITVKPATLLPADQALRLITVWDDRHALCHIKTLNLLPNVLASERARESGADEAVFVRDGLVTEGAHTNIHILKDGVLFTHPEDERILPGVTRAILLDICEKTGIPVREEAFEKETLYAADEVLITSSTLGVRRAGKVDGVPVGGRADALFRTVRNAYDRMFQEELGQ